MKMRAVATAAAFALLAISLPAPAAGQAPPSAAVRAGDVVLRPGDMLRITVWPNSEASGEFTIEESGHVNLPFLEQVVAAGVPLTQLRAELRRRYAEGMSNPVVTVTPLYRVTVTGEVMRPGIQIISPNYSLFEVISMAGGFRPQADPEKVRVVREAQVIEYDALRAMETGEGMDVIQMLSGDHVVVPPRRGSFLTWRNALSILQAISVIAITYERYARTNN